MARSYEGKCHCGALGFVYTTSVEPALWQVRSCQCSFCTRHGARCTSDPNGRLRFSYSEPELLVRYRFALGTADFILCQRCGVYLGAVIATRHGSVGILNLNTLTAELPSIQPATPVFYDAEEKSQRVGRREQLWTPVEGDA